MKRNKEGREFSFPIMPLAGSSLPNFISLRRDYTIDRMYLGRFTNSILLSAFFEPFRWIENICWNSRLKKTELKRPPVFIIGFWRSGTTMMHDLLCQSANASYVTTFQTVFPHMVLCHSWWLKPLANTLAPVKRPFDNVEMGLDHPQEEEIAMANTQRLSFYNALYFPRCYEQFYKRDLFFKEASVKETCKWRKEYLHLIRKALRNIKGEQFISKNPSNMARIPVLLEMFPDARFIFIYRNPYAVVESFFGFLMSVVPAIQLQKQNDELTRALIVRLYSDMIRHYESEKDRITHGNLYEVRYEELLERPEETIRDIYRRFGIPNYGNDLPRMQSYLESHHHGKSHYEISAPTIALVNQFLMDILQKWNYEVKV